MGFHFTFSYLFTRPTQVIVTLKGTSICYHSEYRQSIPIKIITMQREMSNVVGIDVFMERQSELLKKKIK